MARSKRKITGASLTSGRGLGLDGALRGEPAGGGHLFHLPVFFNSATREPDKSHDYHRMCRSAATVRPDANCSNAERVGFECRYYLKVGLVLSAFVINKEAELVNHTNLKNSSLNHLLNQDQQ